MNFISLIKLHRPQGTSVSDGIIHLYNHERTGGDEIKPEDFLRN